MFLNKKLNSLQVISDASINMDEIKFARRNLQNKARNPKSFSWNGVKKRIHKHYI